MEVAVAARRDVGCPFQLLRRQPVPESVNVGAERAGPFVVVRLVAAGVEFSPCTVGKRRDRNFVFGRDRPRDVRSVLNPMARNSGKIVGGFDADARAAQCCFANHRPPGGL